jgi:hypothetical protein
MRTSTPTLVIILCLSVSAGTKGGPAPMSGLEPVGLSADGKHLTFRHSGRRLVVWGFNYDHDTRGRFLEDYWETEWTLVEKHFRTMKQLGANVVRIHLQVGKFLNGPREVNPQALTQLTRLLRLAEQVGLYVDITGLGCYHRAQVPAWYDRLDEAARWQVQAHFWEAVAGCGVSSPAVLCYDLMNEPVVPGGRRAPGDWLAPPFAGKHFVQFITLDPAGRPRPEVARRWLQHLRQAVRRRDPHHLVTVGLVDWSLERPGLTSGFVPQRIADLLDILCVHLYPEQGKLDEAVRTLTAFAAAGKPLLVEETFPLRCSPAELEEVMKRSERQVVGWLGFYWGHSLEELRQANDLQSVLIRGWLELFRRRAQSLPSP